MNKKAKVKEDSSVNENLCQTHLIDKDKVEKAKDRMLSDSDVIDLAELYRALGDATRVKILYALSLGEFCVCDISSLLGMSASAISHQLRILRSLRLVKNRREGRVIYYSLDDEHVLNLFEEGLKHIEHG